MPRLSRPSHLFVLLALGAIAGTPASAEMYRWIDASGREHFTSDPAQVPAAQRAAAAAPRNTRGNLNRVGPSPAAPSPATPTPTSPPAAAAVAPASEKIGGHDEAGWRKRIDDLRAEIERLEPAVEACRKDPQGVPGGFDRVNGYTANRHQRERADDDAEACGKATNQLSYDRTQLERLEEQAHTLGVPPGWLR